MGIVRDGFSLFLSLLILILAFSLVLVAIELYRLSVANYSQQAKLLLTLDLAKSGARTLFEWLRENPSKLNELFQEGTRKSFSARLDGSSQELFYETFKSGSEYVIKCTAKVGGYERSRSVVFKAVGGGSRHTLVSLGKVDINSNAEVNGDIVHLGRDELLLSNDAKINGNVYIVSETNVNISGNERLEISGNVFAKGKIKIHNVHVKGDICCGGTVEESGQNFYRAKHENLSNLDEYFKDLPSSFPELEPPNASYVERNELNHVASTTTIEARASNYYARASKVHIGEGGKLIFETNGNDIHIYITGEFHVYKGTVEVSSGGTVWIYAEKVTFSENAKLILKNGSKVVFVGKSKNGDITFSRDTLIEGDGEFLIYAPEKAVKFSNETKQLVRCAVVAKEIHISNEVKFGPPQNNVLFDRLFPNLKPNLQLVRWE